MLAEALQEVAAVDLPDDDLKKLRAEVARFVPESGPATVPASSEGMVTPLNASQLPAELAEQSQLAGCGKPSLVESEDGGVEVSALIPNQLDRTVLDVAIDAVANARPLALDLDEIEPTLCDVVELSDAARSRLEPLNGVLLRDATGLKKARFAHGDHLIVELPLQPEDAYVWGDYFVHDGQVLHMLPSPITSDNKIPAGASVMLGEPGGEDEEWVIGPAFGNDLLVVFATSQPLYEGNRPQLESITGYLEFLRSRFASVLPGDTIRVATRLVRTEEG